MTWKLDLIIVVLLLGILVLVYILLSGSKATTSTTTSSISMAETTANTTTSLATTATTTALTTALTTATTTTSSVMSTTTIAVTTTVSAAGLFISGMELNGTTVVSEWVEITNSGTDVVMTGYKLKDAANHAYAFTAFSLASNSRVRVHTGSGANNATDLYWGHTGAVWNNKGDTAFLLDSNNATVDEKTCVRRTCWFTD